MALVAYKNRGFMRSNGVFTGAAGDMIDDNFIVAADLFDMTAPRNTINILYPPNGLTACVADCVIDGSGNTTGTDNRAALQAILDYAHAYGYWVYIPAPHGASQGRGYFVSGSLHLDWEDAGVGGGLQGIEGDGQDVSLLIFGDVASGDEALELYAESNDGWRGCLNDFAIICDNSCASGHHDTAGDYDTKYNAAGSSALGLGDARDNFFMHRCSFVGFNGIALRVSNSISYAQIGTRLQHVTVNTNPVGGNPGGWWGAQSTFRGKAIWPKTYGAKWDTVSMHNCTIIGLCHVYGEMVRISDSCNFSTPPMRPVENVDMGGGITTQYNYAGNIWCDGGALITDTIYCEDYETAITCASWQAHIDMISITRSHFSGLTNFDAPYDKAKRCIHALAAGGNELGQVTIEDNRIGYKNAAGTVLLQGNARVSTTDGFIAYIANAVETRIQGNKNLFKPSLLTSPNVANSPVVEFRVGA